MQSGERGNIELEPSLYSSSESLGDSGKREWKAGFMVGAGRKYAVKKIAEFVDAVMNNKYIGYGRNFGFNHDRGAFTENSRKLVDFLVECVSWTQGFSKHWSSYSRNYGDTYGVSERELTFTDERMVAFAQAMLGRECLVGMSTFENTWEERMKFVEQDPVLTIKLDTDNQGGCRMTVPPAECFLGVRKMCIRYGNCFYLCSDEYYSHMKGLARILHPLESKSYYIGAEDMKAFCSVVLPDLRMYTVVRELGDLKAYQPQPCRIVTCLDNREGLLTAELFGVYGEERYNLYRAVELKDMYRELEKEAEAVRAVQEYFVHSDSENERFYINVSEEELVFRGVDEGIARLQQIGQVFISDGLKKIKVRYKPKVYVGISMTGGLLDITLQTDRFSVEELEALLECYRQKKKYYCLKNGEFIKLGYDAGLEALAELSNGLEADPEQWEKGHIQVPEYRSFYLDQVLEESGMEVKRDPVFQVFIRNMKEVDKNDYSLPEGLHAELRPYQEHGYRWLMTLDQLGFGGILADDMGLGKTVQTIAFLLARKQRGSRKSLVVCPASLVYNWESEIRRFSEGLAVDVISGSVKEREEKIKHGSGDVFLTSYDLLKKDLDKYKDLFFDYMILDEAQNIKNYTTQAAKAVKSISSGRRFALTGTPIENSLGELWSIFDFLMPGILGNYKQFKVRYETPIVSRNDEAAAGRLQKMIRPFILRRLKRDVLKELPDKIEKVIYSGMEGEQLKLYLANAQNARDILARIDPNDFASKKFQIFAELTKLRQLCCDPSLVYENYKGEAAKLDTCMELVQNAVASGNKLLLFSQFTSMLERIEGRLNDAEIGYYKLTGSTPKEKRVEMVQEFNEGDRPVFLISLKAGGTGLNLTAAGVVIHYDPWWNMAAQNQATDRAHRIGQKQVVTVYKLIMKGTLEEKILEMQERKAGLSEDIMAEGSIGGGMAGKEELMELLGGVTGGMGE
ncbi:hypothetical protein GPL15_16655 [Clostridium sp. MCC353]|uniref:DEAD/DEAH box helicase n=1 Tax=Clostridium sp. MCC353 TaxID=2592646 RepID=UPI001C014F21|nr:DEAD/DEAH box helicase [Clostridium sp. MCC353]MBT9778133.1 hypothetical protein [Clostridium sp. MCC353]